MGYCAVRRRIRYFHMAHFVAKADQKHEPWCTWNNNKKTGVYGRLAKIINENKRIGIASAVPKSVWDKTPECIRQHYGWEPYTFAVRMCMMRIADWREQSRLRLPIRYIFDWEMAITQKRKEISRIFDVISKPGHEMLGQLFGVEAHGFSFDKKEIVWPLQSADILAWQMRCHMEKIWPLGHDDISLCHDGFKQLRINQEMDLGFFNEDQIEKFVKRNTEWEEQAGHPLPVWYPKPN